MTNKMDKNKKKMWSMSIFVILIIICSSSLNYMLINSNSHMAEAASTWTQRSYLDFNKGTLNNTTIIGSGDSAKLKINLVEMNKWTNATPINSPTRRWGHTMASIYGTDKIIIFGGYYDTNYLDETWIYDLSDNTWSQKIPSSRPSPRYITTMASIHNDDKVVLFGGYDGMNRDDTWVYDLSENSWTSKSPTKNPSARSGCEMENIYGTDKIILFGGNYPGLNDTWIYDLSDNTWTQKTTQNTPIRRYGHAMAAVFNDDKIILFGGIQDTTTRYGDTWIYDLSDNTWTQKSPLNIPTARSYPSLAAVYGDDKAVLFGGITNTYNDETWIYDVSEDKWMEKVQTIKPDVRDLHEMATLSNTSQILLFGGRGWSGSPTIFNDTWIYNYSFPKKNGTYISTPYDMGANSSFGQLSWYAATPENTSITFQLRSASNDLSLNTIRFVGPDGTPSTYYASSPSNICSGHDGDRWFQYKAYFNISILPISPTLDIVEITYNCLPETIIVSPVDGRLLANNKPVFKWTFEDLDSQQQQAFQVLISNEIAFKNIIYDSSEQITTKESWEFPSGTNYTGLPDGKWYWKVRTKDEDNAWTNYSLPISFYIDTQAPSSALIVPINNGFYHHMDMIFGIAKDLIDGSGILKIQLTIKRLTDNYYWNGSNWVALPTWLLAHGTMNWTYDTSTVPWVSGTRYRVQSRAVDFAALIETPDVFIIFTIDKDPPISNIVFPIDNKWVNELNNISGNSFDSSSSGIYKVEISIKCLRDENIWDEPPYENDYWNGTTWTSAEAWLTTPGTDQWSFDTTKIPWSTGDHYTIRSRATDKTSNIEIPGFRTTFRYDNTPPKDLVISINNDTEYTRSTNVQFLLKAEDIGSGLYQMSFSTDSALWSQWEMFNSTRSIELTAGDGKKTIYFKVRDFSGNIAEPLSGSIILDTTPPDGLSIVIDNNSICTNSRQVKIDLKATDRLSGINGISFSNNGIDWNGWELFNQTKYFIFPNDMIEGENKIFFKAKDKVGNIAEPVFDSITLDTDPPHSLEISINNGAPETNTSIIILSLKAKDNISGIGQISLSTDGLTWSEWENYIEEKSYIIPSGDGIKKVYFRAKDNAGNIEGPIISTIILNTTNPEKEVRTIKTPTTSGLDFWMIIFFIAIIIFTLIISGMIIIMKRKQRSDQKLLPSGALTVRPGGLIGPVISVEQMTQPIEQPQLPSSNTTTGTTQPTTSTTPLPMLVKSTQIAQEPAVQKTQQIPQLPQLPSAQIQTQEAEVKVPVKDQEKETTPAPPTAPEPLPTLTPTPAPTTIIESPPQIQPTVAQTPAVNLTEPQPQLPPKHKYSQTPQTP